jgi:hypothetical protein
MKINNMVALGEAILNTGTSPRDLIVMRVNRRPSESLFFGDVAAAVTAKATASIFRISS